MVGPIRGNMHGSDMCQRRAGGWGDLTCHRSTPWKTRGSSASNRFHRGSIENIEIIPARPQPKLCNVFVDLGICWLIIWFFMVDYLVKWLIDAWGWFPILFLTFLKMFKCCQMLDLGFLVCCRNTQKLQPL